ncbi:hypothetical protein Cgig2_030653 [Carnegiea gigantea]|uniref:Uncharacterized protein n=1 Tax=Carnegiea gigantea TaxID=171969 RepID=A0A9Q1K350_9CARY|nr:hypothetical protein Cgig2_030653 [Carnegiea gigantea]
MMIRNSLRRFARCRMLDSPGGCDHFEWIDDSLCDKIRSMVVSLIVSNEILLEEDQHLQRMKEKAACDRDVAKRVREKNLRLRMEDSRLKIQLIGYQMRERKVLWGLLLSLVVLIGIGFAARGGKGRACEVEVPVTVAVDACPEVALLTFSLGLEDREGWLMEEMQILQTEKQDLEFFMVEDGALAVVAVACP